MRDDLLLAAAIAALTGCVGVVGLLASHWAQGIVTWAVG